MAARTSAYRPLATVFEAVTLGAVHHGPTHKNQPRARDGRPSTMQLMRRWRRKMLPTVIVAHWFIFCAGPEEDTAHMRILCARHEAVTRLVYESVKKVTTELPLADGAVVFLAWKETGCRWAAFLMIAVVAGEIQRLCAAVRAVLYRGRAMAKLFLEDMIHISEDVYARRNHRITYIMQLPMHDQRNAVLHF